MGRGGGLVVVALAGLAFAGCGADEGSTVADGGGAGPVGGDGDTATGADTDWGGDGGGDGGGAGGDGSSGDADGTGGGGEDRFDLGGTDGEPPMPEDEEDADFQVPKASGRFVYSAGEDNDSVAVIDSSTLAIDVVAVGRRPTVVQPLPGTSGERGAVAVLNQGSDEVAFVRTDASNQSSVTLREGSEGANNLAVSPDGRFVFAYHDVDSPEGVVTGSTQELVILAADMEAAWQMTVGANPRQVVFTEDSTTAYVVTDDGVNVIPMSRLDEIGKPDVVPVALDPGIDPALLEVHISANRGQALARVDGDDFIAVTDLAMGTQTRIDLPGVPTDLDMAADGTFAVLILPGLSASAIIEVALPPGPEQFETEYVVGQYVGVAELAQDGETMVLYTTKNPHDDDEDDPPGVAQEDPPPDPRQKVTVARRIDGAWTEFSTVWVEIPVRSAGIAPDSANGLLLHEADNSINPDAPWPYTLLDLTADVPIRKLQTVEAAPGPILFTPDGSRSAVLLRDDSGGVKRTDLVNLRNFIVDGIELGSPPEGAGYVEATDKIFVAQEHPLGRITFIGAGGDVQTVTGYELNDSVKD